MKTFLMDWVAGLVGAVLGGAVGYFAFEWGARQGLWAGVLPGAFVGLGCGLLSTRRSLRRGIVCGLGAFSIGLYADWSHTPDFADKDLLDVLSRLPSEPPLILIMLILGTFLGFYWGRDAFKPNFGSFKSAPRG